MKSKFYKKKPNSPPKFKKKQINQDKSVRNQLI